MRAKPLSSVIPIIRWLDKHVFLTKTGHVGVFLRIKGIHRDCLSSSAADTYTARFLQSLRAFGDECQIYQWIVKNDGAKVPVASHAANELARQSALDRKQFLESREEGLFESGIYFCILHKPKKIGAKPDPRGVNFSLKLSSHLKMQARILDRNRKTVFLRARGFISEMGDLIGPELLSAEEAHVFFRGLVNLDPSLASAVPLKGTEDVDQRTGSVHLYLNPEGISSNYRYMRVLSMKDTPQKSGPNMLADVYRIKGNFVLCLYYEPYTVAQSLKEIANASHHFSHAQWMRSLGNLGTMVFNKFSRKSEIEGVLVDESAKQNLDEINQLSAALNNDDVLGEMVFTLVLHDADAGKLDAAAGAAIQAIGQHGGDLFLETYNARDAFLGILPGNKRYTLERSYLVLRSTIADMSLFYRTSTGEQTNDYLGTEYLFAAENGDGEPYYVSTNYGQVNNMFLFGHSGSGKSLLSNKILEGNIKNGARLMVLCQGHDYKELCEKYGGSYVNFDFDRQDFFINPFSLPGTPRNIRFLSTFIRLLLRNNGYSPTLDDNRTIWEGINDLYENGERSDRRLRNVPMRREARLALSNWIQDGEDAWLFDNLDDSVTFSNFQVFELQGVEEEEMAVFLEPMLFYLFKRWEQNIQDPELLGVQKIFHVDEAWRYLLNKTARNKTLSLAKRLRKHNGGVYFVTQSPEDLRRVGMLESLTEAFPTRMWVANPIADRKKYQRLFGWNEAETEAFMGLHPQRDVMVKKGERPAELFYVNLAPEDLAMVGNDPVGNIKREMAKKRNGRLAAAAGR